jgi:hypothetical protein
LLCRAYHCAVIVLLSLESSLLASNPSPVFNILRLNFMPYWLLKAMDVKTNDKSRSNVWVSLTLNFPQPETLLVYASCEGITSDIYNKGVTGDFGWILSPQDENIFS